METVGKANVLCQVLARKEPTLESSEIAWLEYNLGQEDCRADHFNYPGYYCYPPSFSDIIK